MIFAQIMNMQGLPLDRMWCSSCEHSCNSSLMLLSKKIKQAKSVEIQESKGKINLLFVFVFFFIEQSIWIISPLPH